VFVNLTSAGIKKEFLRPFSPNRRLSKAMDQSVRQKNHLLGHASIELPEREIGNLLPNNRRQRRTCYALCHILYPVSAAHTSIFRMDSNSTSYSFPQQSMPPVTLITLNSKSLHPKLLGHAPSDLPKPATVNAAGQLPSTSNPNAGQLPSTPNP